MATRKKKPVARRRAVSSKPARKQSRPAAKKRARPVKSAAPTEKARLARNKKLVLTLYQKLIGEKDFEAASKYMGATYVQHAPYAVDGRSGVRDWLKGFKEAFPNHRYQVKRIIAEGDFVMLHCHGEGGPNPNGESVVDIFRVENGKVVEHWDIIQPIPDSALNANSMF